MTRQECIEEVSQPGKFEGEAPYVPYFWNLGLQGFADRETKTFVWGFDVTLEDKALFPELKRRHTVNLIERTDGLVTEI